MNEQNLKYIANLKAQDVPWSRLTTAYGRASGFSGILRNSRGQSKLVMRRAVRAASKI